MSGISDAFLVIVGCLFSFVAVALVFLLSFALVGICGLVRCSFGLISFGLSYRSRSPILFVSYLWFLRGGITVAFEWGIGDSLACFGWALGCLGVRWAVAARSSEKDLGWSGWRLAAVSALFVLRGPKARLLGIARTSRKDRT